MHDEKAIIVFVRVPELGKVKTRLAATVGEENALKIYNRLLEHTRSVLMDCDATLFVFFADDIPAHDSYWQDAKNRKHVQQGTGLGERITNAFRLVFQQQFTKTVIVGSDCPELKTEHIKEAFDSLNNNDAVIGPAADGGYYLLGMKMLHKSLFENISWSTESVLKETMANAAQAKLTVAMLPVLNDVDTEADLPESYKLLLQN